MLLLPLTFLNFLPAPTSPVPNKSLLPFHVFYFVITEFNQAVSMMMGFELTTAKDPPPPRVRQETTVWEEEVGPPQA